MRRHLREEIQQTKPFESLEVEVYLEILQTAQVTGRIIVDALKPSGLSPSQFNVLRILRGARPELLAASRISERMVNHDPDLTRLLDRLEANGLIEKSRDAADRRVMNVGITARGLEVVEAASQSIRTTLGAAFAAVGPRKLETLADLLELVRDSARGNGDGHPVKSKTLSQGERHGNRKADHSRHRSDGQAGRSSRARAAREGAQGARDDASPRRRGRA